MSLLNVEIKARCADPVRIRRLLMERNARFIGEDRQVDTYFHVASGRLKLREGTIERALIHYQRDDRPGPKRSEVMLYDPGPGDTLKALLTRALGVWVVVDKRREIYFIDTVKFHLDQVEGLGAFVEIEAIDETGAIGEEKLRTQCEQYMTLFQIRPEDLDSGSYSDLLAVTA